MTVCNGSNTRAKVDAKKTDACPACGQKVKVFEAPSGEARLEEHDVDE